jgi:hypothetical protein
VIDSIKEMDLNEAVGNFGATRVPVISKMGFNENELIRNNDYEQIMEDADRTVNDKALKEYLIHKWEKEIENLKFNSPIENIPRLNSYHRKLIKKGLKTLWLDLIRDIEKNNVVINLKEDNNLDKEFMNVYAEFVTIKLQSHIISNLKVHQSKKKPNNIRGKGPSRRRIISRVYQSAK